MGEATIKSTICKYYTHPIQKNYSIPSIASHDCLTRNTLIKRDPLVEKLWTGGQSINEEQKKSVRIAVENKFQLIQGPPGTYNYTVQ